MKVERRRGVATVLGMIILVIVVVASIASYALLESSQLTSTNSSNKQQSTSIQKGMESLKFGTNNGTLTFYNGWSSASYLVDAILSFANGTVQYLPLNLGLNTGQSYSVSSMVQDQNNCGPYENETCYSAYQTIISSTPSSDPTLGNKIGMLTSLGNVFWLIPAKETLVADPATTVQDVFDATGAAIFGSSPVVGVDGVNYTYSQLPVTFTWLVGTQHNYTYYTYSNGGTVLSPYTTGLSTQVSQSLTATMSGTVRAYYTSQYMLTVIGGNNIVMNPSSSNGFYPSLSPGVYQQVQVTSDYAWAVSSTSRTLLTGYSLDGGPVVSLTRQLSGQYTTPAISMNGPHVLVFTSVTQYYLTNLVGSGSGTVSPSSGWYDSGTNVQISATASGNYVFNGWSGFGTKSYSGGTNKATITVDSPISETASFTYVPPPPPPSGITVTSTCSPCSGTATLLVSFTSSVSGGTAPYSYSWSFGDGGVSTAQNPSYSYMNTGTWTATVTVTDANGLKGSHTLTISVGSSSSMQVSAGCSSPSSCSGVPPLSVSFDSSVVGGTAPYTYSWAFGDGGTSTAANPSHTYSSDGTYKVGLVVYDSQGHSASASVTVTVSTVPPATVPFTFTESGLPTGISWQVTFNGNTKIASSPNSIVFSVTPGSSFSWTTPAQLYTSRTAYFSPSPQYNTGTVGSSGSTQNIAYTGFYYVTFGTSPSSDGSVSPCTCSTWWPANAQVDLSASPATYFEFLSWSGTQSSGGNPFTVYVTGPMSETANFGMATSFGSGSWTTGSGGGGLFTGVLYGSNGLGVPGATVSVTFINGGGSTTATGTTDSNGVFTINTSFNACYADASFSSQTLNGIPYVSSSHNYGPFQQSGC